MGTTLISFILGIIIGFIMCYSFGKLMNLYVKALIKKGLKFSFDYDELEKKKVELNIKLDKLLK